MGKSTGTPLVLKNDQGLDVIAEEQGKEIKYTKDYGCGIDVHSRMIAVSVLVKRDLAVYEYHRNFSTDWNTLVAAKDWVINVIMTNSSPVVELSSNFHYCVESTSSYHCVVIKAWKGTPSIVNPVLARAGTKKTDNLDARTLAVADLTGTWPASFIPSTDVVELRMLVDERVRCQRKATQVSNHLNNALLKLGINAGQNGSISKNEEVRSAVEAMLSDSQTNDDSTASNTIPHPASEGEISDLSVPSTVPSPPAVPEDVRCLFIHDYEEYDKYCSLSNEYSARIMDKIESMQWETATGEISGSEMMSILTSAPGIGPQTAVLWLSRVVTPRRFPNEKALAAYCGCDPSLKVSAGKVISTVKRGGRKDLHSAFCIAASNLMRLHNEPFGKFGYNIAMQTGIWKKGVSALARKLTVALYYMALLGEKFSYEKYKMIQEPAVLNIPIETLVILNPAFRRYVRYLMRNNIQTTQQLIHQYYICALPSVKGLGKNFFALVKDFIDGQEKYIDKYERMTDHENTKAESIS